MFASPLAPVIPPNAAQGHRERMRLRLLQSGPDALLDHEMLEMILFLALPRRDTKPIARALLDRFRDFPGVITAPLNELRNVEGLGDAGVAALKVVQAAALRLMQRTLLDRPVLNDWAKLTDYLTAVLGRERTEQFRILFLDARNRLVADEQQQRGTVNHAPVYPREIVRRALDLHATALILVHNHPSGDPQPSQADLEMTREIVRAAQTLGVVVHDHVIIGAADTFSFRGAGLL